MHLLLSALVTEGVLCIGGGIAMAYWTWRAVPDTEVAEGGFEDVREQVFRTPVSPVDSWKYSLVKRGFDLTVAVTMLIVFAIPGCIIAALVALTSKGPVFYREKRIGRYGYLFQIWKFRSMYQDANQRQQKASQGGDAHIFWRMHKSSRDPRITRIGFFLRRWSLDELPQVLNVLTGEMSLIGPRPIVEPEVPAYGKLFDHYVEVTPGLSGLWQVSGRSNVGYQQRSELDAQYVRNWSLGQDLRILLYTVPAVLRRIGAK
jgi:exopolysaccharide production protein ExoY